MQGINYAESREREREQEREERELAAALHLKYDQYNRAMLSVESKAQTRLSTGIRM